MLEKCLIRFCSPTLAGLKTANMFTYEFESDVELLDEVKNCNLELRNKGITVSVMKRNGNRALIYVYRKARLLKTFMDIHVVKFLERYGYTVNRLENVLARLKHRITDSFEFPHEIGVFLGYPLGDVIGFIENSGRNCKCCGCWKVYCDECQARKTFAQYKKCTNVYMNLYTNGTPVQKLAVNIM